MERESRSGKGKQSFSRKPSDRKPSDRKPSDRKPSDRKPNSTRRDDNSSQEKRSFNRDSARKTVTPRDGARSTSKTRSGAPARDENRRVRKFAEPAIPEEVTGKELDKKDAFALQSLATENAEMVAKHLVALNMFLETDPQRAYWHGQSAVFRAGRVAIVREKAGIAALRFEKYDVAIKELRAAQRIAGSPSVLPYLAQCELALGDPRKTLEIAGSVDPKVLTPEQRVELRIAAAGARTALGQHDAAVVTLTCPELGQNDPQWSKKLRTAYRDALLKADRVQEAETFTQRYPQSFSE